MIIIIFLIILFIIVFLIIDKNKNKRKNFSSGNSFFNQIADACCIRGK